MRGVAQLERALRGFRRAVRGLNCAIERIEADQHLTVLRMNELEAQRNATEVQLDQLQQAQARALRVRNNILHIIDEGEG